MNDQRPRRVSRTVERLPADRLPAERWPDALPDGWLEEGRLRPVCPPKMICRPPAAGLRRPGPERRPVLAVEQPEGNVEVVETALVPVGEEGVEGERHRGRPMAIFSYASVMFGVPVFLAVFAMRDNAFALHHARAAACVFLLFYLMIGLSFLSCAFFLPLAMVCYIPALVGIHHAAAGREAGKAALGDAGERLFGWIRPRES